jgi:hypothetical protein
MGYDVHITRAENWVDNDDHKIEASEWLALIESDPDLRLAGYNGPHFAIWDGHPVEDEAWLDWRGGNIETKNPDDPLLRKMIEIAGRLDAKVQGDDGEFYTEASLIAPKPKPPLFWTLPFLSFSLAAIALPCLLILNRLDSFVRQQYPAGTPMPTKWIVVFTIFAGIGVLSFLVGGIFAVSSFILREDRSVFAWLGLALTSITICFFLIWP